MKNEGYINIQGWMINELKLKGNELLLYALIYGFSQDGKSQYRGSISYIQNALKISNRNVIDNINKLIDKKLIEKKLNTTGNLYSANLKVVNKVHGGCEESSQVSCEQSSYNNNLYNNKDNSETSSHVISNSPKKEKLNMESVNKAIEWSVNRRGGKFLLYGKQTKAFKIAKEAGISINDLVRKWKEMETSEYWKGKDFDWMNVVKQFNKLK